MRRIMVSMTTATRVGVVPEWTLGWRLQRALAHAGMTTLQMADEIGVTRATISRWVNDHGAPPRAIYLRHWAMRTGVPLAWLEGGSEPDGTGAEVGSDPRPTLYGVAGRAYFTGKRAA